MRSRPLAFAVMVWSFAIPAWTVPQSAPVIHVDDDAPLGGNGSGGFPYNNLADALEKARLTNAAVIQVAPGDYAIGSTLVIEQSHLDLRGSSLLVKEEGSGWPTGNVQPGTETRIIGTALLGTQPLVAVGRRPSGGVVNEVGISGFVFAGASAATIEMTLTRVQNFSIHDNVFRGLGMFGVESTASSGSLVENYFSGVGTGAILAGGYPSSPSKVTVKGNRSVQNNLGGVLLNGASIGIPELGDELDAVVRDNDLSQNGLGTNSFGLRLFVIRRDLGAPGDTQSTSKIRALVQSNRLVGNLIGISVDAGFPYRRVGTLCDTRVYTATIDLKLQGNTVADSVLTPALVTFTRNTSALIPSMLPQWQYLHAATFTITDPQGTLAGAWIDHPERDPFLGPCPEDAVNEPLGNILRYNDLVMTNGRNF